MSRVDLSRLTIEGSPERSTGMRRPRGPRLAVVVVGVVAMALVASFAWPLLRPLREVRMARVSAVETAGQPGVTGPTSGTGSGSPVAEAVGWVEADPFPTVVRPLVAGRLARLEVLEGSAVVAGETVLGSLESAALQAAAERAEAVLLERESEVVQRRAERTLAEDRLRQNAAARLRLHEAESAAAMLGTRLGAAREELRAAAADAASARAVASAQEQLQAAGSSYPVALERARSAAESAVALEAAAEQRVAGLEAELEAQRATVALCLELVREPVDLRGALAVAEAARTHAEARRDQARTERSIAARELDWATVKAPVDGVVLRLEAEPGEMVGPGHRGLVALYDPARLRARIDVPFDSLAEIREGQPVEIRSEALGEASVRGVVQRLVHEADLLKNTLQVQVELIDPPRLLRPETLCRARFLRGAVATGPEADSGQAAPADLFLVPAEAVRDGAVFVFDPAAAAVHRVPVEVVGRRGDRTRVRGALSPTWRVALERVTDGERVQEVVR